MLHLSVIYNCNNYDCKAFIIQATGLFKSMSNEIVPVASHYFGQLLLISLNVFLHCRQLISWQTKLECSSLDFSFCLVWYSQVRLKRILRCINVQLEAYREVFYTHTHTYIFIGVCVCVCVYVRVWERERERERFRLGYISES